MGSDYACQRLGLDLNQEYEQRVWVQKNTAAFQLAFGTNQTGLERPFATIIPVLGWVTDQIGGVHQLPREIR